MKKGIALFLIVVGSALCFTALACLSVANVTMAAGLLAIGFAVGGTGIIVGGKSVYDMAPDGI